MKSCYIYCKQFFNIAMTEVVSSTFFALIAAGSLVFGSVLPSAAREKLSLNRLAMIIGFSAGLMLAAALHELLPEALEKAQSQALIGAGLGFMVLYVVERLTHFHACRHRECNVEGDDHVHGHVHTHANTTLLGIGLHNFIDGLITAAAFAVSSVAGILVLCAIVLHQIAVGVSLGALLLRAGTQRKQALISTAMAGSFIVWGALCYYVLPVNEAIGGFLLGVAGGSFLYIGACDLLPEAHHKDEGLVVMLSTLCGYAFAFAMTRVFPHGH
jgi:zinc and cadmium transporter